MASVPMAPAAAARSAARAGQVVPTGTPTAPRFDQMAALLPDGSVLIVGGYGSRPLEGAVAHAWLYRP
jgi:hypothetical protein